MIRASRLRLAGKWVTRHPRAYPAVAANQTKCMPALDVVIQRLEPRRPGMGEHRHAEARAVRE
jgi:hypothetical protein